MNNNAKGVGSLRKKLRRFRLAVAAVLTALTLVAVAAPAAFANEPGESNTWSAEMAGQDQVRSVTGSVSEARDPYGNHALVTTNTTGQVVLTYNSGSEYTWWDSQTYATPQIIWTNFGWRVFHTGGDRHVYYAGFTVNSDGSITLGSWVQVPGNVLSNIDNPPGVVAVIGPVDTTSEEWELVWTGTDNQLYAQWHIRYQGDNNIGYFASPQTIPGATSYYGPNIAFDGVNQRFYAVWTGTDNLVYAALQSYGSGYWGNTVRIGGYGYQFNGVPAIRFVNNGFDGLVVAHDSVSDTYRISAIDDGNTPLTTQPWSAESTNWGTGGSAALVAVAATILYLLAPDNNGYVYNKQAYQQ